MPKTFDAILKQIIDRFADDWKGALCMLLGLPEGTQAEPLDPDLSTVSPQADKVFRLSGASTGFIHLELQTSWDADLPDRLLLYSVLIEHRYGGPVTTVLVLLRREANASNLTGTLTRTGPKGEYLRFQYRIVKLWEAPIEPLISGPLGASVLALLTDAAQPQLHEHLLQLNARLDREVPRETGDEIMTACKILLGLRYDKAGVERFFQGVRQMRESSTYQAILEEGRIEGECRARRDLLREVGQERFGPLAIEQESLLVSINDVARLQRMNKRLMKARDWIDLLSTP